RQLVLGQLPPSVWAWALPTLWLIVTLAAGTYPALALGVLKVKDLMLSTYQRQRAQGHLRKALVLGQFVVCIGLVSLALVLQQQIRFLGDQQLGYRSASVLSVNLAGSRNQAGKQGLETTVGQLVGVRAVTRTQSYPGISTSGYSVSDPTEEGKYHGVSANQVQMGAEDLLDLKLLAGHFLRQRPEGDTIVDVVINEHFAGLLGYDDPQAAIGQDARNLFRNNTQIVGVVKDFHFESLHHPIGAYAFHNGDYANTNQLLIQVENGQLETVLPALQQAFQQHLPEAAFDYRFLDQTARSFYESEQRTTQIVQLFTLLTICISVLGLLGLAAFAAAKRTKEISIRKILGASVAQIIYTLSRDFVGIIVVAIFLATPLAYWLAQRWLTDFAYRISLSWTVFAVAGLVALLIAIVTIAGQSWRAATANPVDALQRE
ncbi:MAG: FtsX-like permease family protein, partial [Bacteroidota bacterium]